jgi:hypothetical protein
MSQVAMYARVFCALTDGSRATIHKDGVSATIRWPGSTLTVRQSGKRLIRKLTRSLD